MVKHVVISRSLVARLGQPQSLQVEPVLALWSQGRKAPLWARAAQACMHSIVKLRAGISEERHALREQWSAEQHWVPVSALPRVANEPRQSARVRAQPVLISTHVASVITDVTKP